MILWTEHGAKPDVYGRTMAAAANVVEVMAGSLASCILLVERRAEIMNN